MLSFGTAGCNLGCKFCQNWDISKSREMDRLADRASPEAIARAAEELGCRSVAFTYNDPVIFLEYAVDVARACHAQGIRTVAVTAGYVCAEPRAEFFRHMDAVNVDLKAFSEEFYTRLCSAELRQIYAGWSKKRGFAVAMGAYFAYVTLWENVRTLPCVISRGEGVARSRRLRVIAHDVRSSHPGQVRPAAGRERHVRPQRAALRGGPSRGGRTLTLTLTLTLPLTLTLTLTLTLSLTLT